MRFILMIMLLIVSAHTTFGQGKTDTSTVLKEVVVSEIKQNGSIARLDSIKGTFIFSGKKNEVIKV